MDTTSSSKTPSHLSAHIVEITLPNQTAKRCPRWNRSRLSHPAQCASAAVGCSGFWAAGMPEAPALLGLLADEPFIDVDQLDELLTIAAMIGMILLGQGPKALFDLREPRVRWQPQQCQ